MIMVPANCIQPGYCCLTDKHDSIHQDEAEDRHMLVSFWFLSVLQTCFGKLFGRELQVEGLDFTVYFHHFLLQVFTEFGDK